MSEMAWEMFSIPSACSLDAVAISSTSLTDFAGKSYVILNASCVKVVNWLPF